MDDQDDEELEVLAGSLPNSYFSTDAYLKQSGSSKLNDLWTMIQSTAGTASTFYNDITQGQIMIEALDPTFSTKGDAMPSGRGKFIHTVGVVGKVNFVPAAGSPYTGLFKGASNGLVRLSSAVPPSLDGMIMKGLAMAPGMGLKFLRDGVDSGNLVAMYAADGQPGNWNFFANDFVNHIPPAEGIKPKALSKKFSTVTKYIQEIGLSDFAKYDEHGAASGSAVFPFSLRFAPTTDVKNLFPASAPKDPMAYMQQLPTVPKNAALYTVYAMDKPKELGGKETMIGTLKL